MAVRGSVGGVMEGARGWCRRFTQDEGRGVVVGCCRKGEVSVFWTYNKRRWDTTIADGRKDKW